MVMPESGPDCAMTRQVLLRRESVNSVERTRVATGGSVRSPVVTDRGRTIVAWPPRQQLHQQAMDNRSEHGEDGADQRRSAALIGLIIILALAIAGVVLVRELRERSRIEDCLMSGRTNCAPIEVPLRR